ncbi:VanZ family protein [Agrilactobacillus fermenti]|uniref:VanZ family protein n=1 Tax=Agrilactobacillus fermenti TaxID=2586909 RepID=UPI001E60CD81|nr:VanZ family protein [Agrilactobacillus fermenti]MCD2256317.1 VanZ family protein [Agrilactobacillus fermenti]
MRCCNIKRNHIFIIIVLVIISTLLISSSMTYQEQTSVPFLQKVLANQPFKQQLAHISFSYAGKTQSIAAIGYFKFIEFFIRKGAHFLTYFILGLSTYLGFQNRIRGRWFAGITFWLACTGFAATDEFHQMLTGDRTPLFQDVMLDSMASLLGLLLALGICWRRRKIKL